MGEKIARSFSKDELLEVSKMQIFNLNDLCKLDGTKEKLAKTEGGHQKQIHYNPTWNYFKELIKKELHSEEGSRIYAKRKIDVEPVFGRLKSVLACAGFMSEAIKPSKRRSASYS